MRSKTISGNTVEPFDRKTTKKLYRNAKQKNDERKLGVVSVDDFPRAYVDEKRAVLNQAIWNRNIPAQCPNGRKQYKTIQKAYAKLIYDAQFYVGSWEKVKEVARESPYLTEF